MKKLLIAAATLTVAATSACAPTQSSSEQLVEYLSTAAPPEVEIVSAECDDRNGVCTVYAESSFHSPEPASVGYWCRVSTAEEFEAECPGVTWLQGSRGTPLDEGLASFLVKVTPYRNPVRGLAIPSFCSVCTPPLTVDLGCQPHLYGS